MIYDEHARIIPHRPRIIHTIDPILFPRHTVTMPIFSRIRNALLDTLIPPSCVGCGRVDTILCDGCRASWRFSVPSCFLCGKACPKGTRREAGATCHGCRRRTSVDVFLAPLLMETSSVRKAIHSYKYRRVRGFAPLFGQMILSYAEYHRVVMPAGSVVVAIPLHPRRERARGFNQADLLARDVCSRTPLCYGQDALKRIRPTSVQASLMGSMRKRNIEGAFAVPDPGRILGNIIILIDDVKTTGATLNEAARTLKEAGARRVWAVTVAR